MLDLACGSGRNGLYLVAQGQPVVFADREQSSLATISNKLDQNPLSSFWCVDFEAADRDPLAGLSFSAIIVIRYLHRPLMQSIKNSIQPGGLIIYETFTIDQHQFGRPKNRDFLLQPGELADAFEGWEVLHHFEGLSISELSGKQQAISQLVARKPD